MNKARWVVDGSIASVNLPKGIVLIDVEDMELVCAVPGYLEIKNGYAYIRADKRRALHRIIMQPHSHMEVDHANHNPLDNRRSNLRVCHRWQNARNCLGHSNRRGSKWKGVCFHDCKKYNATATGKKPWRAYTRTGGKRIWLGYYATEDDAARAYNDYAIKTFGDFACLNRLDSVGARQGSSDA